MVEPILNTHNKLEHEASHSGDFDKLAIYKNEEFE